MSNNTFNTFGILKSIGETRQVSEKYRVRSVLITLDADEKYPQDIQFQVMNNDCENIEKYPLGSNVALSFSLRGNSKEGRHFVNLNITAIKLANG